ncbi:hypothetical protein LOZ65_000362 [Ophidiomyces ophidiicola]|nr:hypothetical protein LOZ65_000362 [Ophidiomyces ophidiicola]
MSDPKHPQPGAPWYITKNCKVAARPSNIGYCKQAKSGFACTIIMITIFTAQLILAIISCLPTDEIRERKRQELEEQKTLEELKSLKSPCYPNFVQGENGLQPITPRTMAFNKLSGGHDLPLRSQPPDSSAASTDARTPAQQPTPTMYFPPPPKKPTGKGKT